MGGTCKCIYFKMLIMIIPSVPDFECIQFFSFLFSYFLQCSTMNQGCSEYLKVNEKNSSLFSPDSIPIHPDTSLMILEAWI